MAAEDVQFLGDLLSGVNSLIADLDHFVDPEKRVAVRNQGFNFGSVHIVGLTLFCGI